MAITQFGFIGFILIKHKYIGVQRNHEDLEAFCHFWRVISYMIGIKDRFNACTDSYHTTAQRLDAILTNCLRPALENTPKQFYEMSDALISGLWSFNPFLNTDAFIYFVKRISGCTGYYYFESEAKNDEIQMITSNGNGKVEKVEKIDNESHVKSLLYTLGGYSRFILGFLIIIHQFLLQIFIFRWYFNGQIILSRFLITYFPFLAFPKFGFRDSYVRILKTEAVD